MRRALMLRVAFPLDFYVHHFANVAKIVIPGARHSMEARCLHVRVYSSVWHEPWKSYIELGYQKIIIDPQTDDIVVTLSSPQIGFVRVIRLEESADA
jgi:hypothetical protein